MFRMRFMPADEEERALSDVLADSWLRFLPPFLFLLIYLALPLFL